MVEVDHSNELLQALDGVGLREVPDGLHLAWKGNQALVADSVTKEVDGGCAELTLGRVEGEAVFVQGIKRRRKCFLCSSLS